MNDARFRGYMRDIEGDKGTRLERGWGADLDRTEITDGLSIHPGQRLFS